MTSTRRLVVAACIVPALIVVACRATPPAEPPPPAVVVEPSLPAPPEPPAVAPAPPEPADDEADGPAGEEADGATVAAARDLFAAGAMAFDAGDYVRARELFAKAYQLVPKPQLLFNIVKAAEREGNQPVACQYYRDLEQAAASDPKLQRLMQGLHDPC